MAERVTLDQIAKEFREATAEEAELILGKPAADALRDAAPMPPGSLSFSPSVGGLYGPDDGGEGD